MQYTNDYVMEVLGNILVGIDGVLSLLEHRLYVCCSMENIEVNL